MPPRVALLGLFHETNTFSEVAADYAAGRTASVTVTPVARLLVDSGDPLPMQAGQVTSLRDIGKPNFVA